MFKTASLSDCGHYRYWLLRVWDDSSPALPFVMLNPSTADASIDDPTIRRCMSFAEREGAGGLSVFNLFAYRATDPATLKGLPSAQGPNNPRYLDSAMRYAVKHGVPVVCAWGSARIAQPEASALKRRAAVWGVDLVCLGKTKDGSPRHPLYLKKTSPLQFYA